MTPDQNGKQMQWDWSSFLMSQECLENEGETKVGSMKEKPQEPR